MSNETYESILDNTTDIDALKVEANYWHDRLRGNKAQMGQCRSIKDKKQRGQLFAKLNAIHDMANDNLAAVMRRLKTVKA